MKLTPIVTIGALFAWTATNGFAQTGLYGSPEPISFTQSPTYPAQGGYNGSGNNGHVVQMSSNDPVALSPTPAIPIADVLSQPTPAAPQVAPSVQPPAVPVDAGTSLTPCMAGQIGQCGDGCNGCGDWNVTVRALFMTRDKPNTVYTSAESNNQTIQGSFTNVDSTWGGEVDVAREFCCGEYAIEGVFWSPGLMQINGGPGIPGPYLSPLVMSTVNLIGPGNTVIGTGNQWTDNFSPSHQVWRTDECYNFEANFWKNHFAGCATSAWNVDGMVGFRYFSFRDRYLFGAERNPTDGSPYAGDWLYMNDDVKNSLAGFQFGFNLDWRFADHWKFFVTPKFGVFNNYIQLNYDLYAISNANGYKYQGSSQNYTNPNYPVSASKDSFSFLGQLDVGVDWQATSHISLQVGYRLVGVTGIGLSDNQIPIYATDTQAISNINKNGDLTLNGAFAGLCFTF